MSAPTRRNRDRRVEAITAAATEAALVIAKLDTATREMAQRWGADSAPTTEAEHAEAQDDTPDA